VIQDVGGVRDSIFCRHALVTTVKLLKMQTLFTNIIVLEQIFIHWKRSALLRQHVTLMLLSMGDAARVLGHFTLISWRQKINLCTTSQKEVSWEEMTSIFYLFLYVGGSETTINIILPNLATIYCC
jgi:hypothetical protein